MLNDEQKKELAEMYSYSDKANYTDEELELAKKMFDTPEKFALLRKILQVLTPEERGITISTSQAFVETSITDLHKYAIETAVNHLADEKVKQLLYSFYRLLKNKIVTDKTKVLEEKNKKEEDEAKMKEEFAKNKEKEVLNLGPNL